MTLIEDFVATHMLCFSILCIPAVYVFVRLKSVADSYA